MAARRQPTTETALDPEVRYHLALERLHDDLKLLTDELKAVRGHLDTLQRHTAALNEKVDSLDTQGGGLEIYKAAQHDESERERLKRERRDRMLSEVWNKGGSWFLAAIMFLVVTGIAKVLDLSLPVGAVPTSVVRTTP